MEPKFAKGKKFFIWTRNPQQGYLKWECVAVIVSPGLTNLLLPKFYEVYGVENIRCFDSKIHTPETVLK